MKRTICIILTALTFISVFFCGCKKDDGKVTLTINTYALSPAELADLDKFARDNGYESAVYNKKKDVIEVVLSDIEHDKLTYTLGVTVIRNVYALIDSKDYPYIKDINRNDNFTDMTVKVSKKEYEADGKGNAISDFIGDCCTAYLAYEEMKQKDKVCTVKITDSETGDVLSEKIYKVSENQ